jgi:sulfide:quinone oxidoreductase
MPDHPTHVVIAGGGVAALEALMALRHHAGDRVELTLLTPVREHTVRAMAVAEPFGQGRVVHASVAAIAHAAGAALVPASLARVDADARIAHTDEHDEVHYDVLVVATGAQMVRPLPGVQTFVLDTADLLSGLLLDLEEDYEDSVAFVMPPGPSWPLPAYELALMTMAEVRGMNRHPRVVVITPEPRPLAAFERSVSDTVKGVLASAGVEVRTSSSASVDGDGTLIVTPPGERLESYRIVALPQLIGPSIPGLPATHDGVLATDAFGAVLGVPAVYAVGDVADWPIKQGGLAAQQADAAAEHIAAAVGAPIEPVPFSPVLHGTLLTGYAPEQLGDGERARLRFEPAAKVQAPFLTPYLVEHATA